jgi:hypothetical protein
VWSLAASCERDGGARPAYHELTGVFMSHSLRNGLLPTWGALESEAGAPRFFGPSARPYPATNVRLIAASNTPIATSSTTSPAAATAPIPSVSRNANHSSHSAQPMPTSCAA